MVRLSEKTIELNFCAQLLPLLGGWGPFPGAFWFGLTQRQEAMAGFDACMRYKGRLLLFQFKASNRFVGGVRRFEASHAQLVELQRQVRVRRSVFYVFPDYGDTRDLVGMPFMGLLSRTYLLDVRALPKPIGAPTTRLGTLRKSGHHLVDLITGPRPMVRIHSDPQEAPIAIARDMLTEQAEVGLQPGDRDSFLELASAFSDAACGLVIPAR